MTAGGWGGIILLEKGGVGHSLVARLDGVQEVGGLDPFTPTIKEVKMGKKRTTNHHESATFQQLWNDLGSKLIQAAQEQLSLNQQVQGSIPWRLILDM